jgi:hypothetical protein
MQFVATEVFQQPAQIGVAQRLRGGIADILR